MDDIIERARLYATSAHARINQFRKYSLQPYDVHLKAVADLVATVCDDAAMIAAAWLHDTVEDTPATFEDLEQEFGLEVMELVKELTDVSKPSDGNRARRKEIDRQHLAGVSRWAKTIKLADVIDNCEDICRHDPRFGRTYLAEMKALMEVLREGDQRLYDMAARIIDKCSAVLDKDSPKTAPSPQPPLLNTIIPTAEFPNLHGIRVFTEAFSARDIQRILPSYDAGSLATLATGAGEGTADDICGIRTNGRVTGYVTNNDLIAGPPHRPRPIEQRQIVDFQAPLTDVIHTLTSFTYCFVSLDGAVIGVISRNDIEKPVVRMWLFGIIILIEMLVVEDVRRKWKDESWFDSLSEGRRQKALQLQAERQRRGVHADLLDCLQFSDKLQLLLRDPQFVESLEFQSVSAAKRVLKDLESLRNNLAHGQDITRHDWPQIVRLARRLCQFFA